MQMCQGALPYFLHVLLSAAFGSSCPGLCPNKTPTNEASMTPTIIALIVFLFPLAYSPGPGNMFFAAIGARFGARASIPASLGYHAATWVVTFAIGYGFMQVLAAYPAIFVIMQWAGAAYMLWLAWLFLRAGTTEGEMEARPARFVDGAVLLVLNPKAYVIIALMFTQFLSPHADNFLWLLVVITTVFTLNNLVAFTVWTLLGDALGRLFRSEQQARRLNVAFGITLIVVALWMLLH
jgi:threonine/homoserine/homoserine lactone efflux protein